MAVSLAVMIASSTGIVAVGAAIGGHMAAWNDYVDAQAQLTAAEHDHDAAATSLDQARTAAVAEFTTAKTLHDRSTAHGVLLTAAAQVGQLGTDLTTLTTAAGIIVDTSGAVTAAPASFSPSASSAPRADERSGTAEVESATAALTALTRTTQSDTAALTARTKELSAATAALQTSTQAAADAQHLPVTGEPTDADPHCASVPNGTRTVFVSIADQHMWACEGTELKLDTAVTTGATAITNVDDSTPTGTFAVQGKTQNTVLRGSDANGSWNDPVTYWIPFTDGVGFHDASWQTFPFGSARYTTDGSHACVHTPLDALATLYGWLRTGDRVVVS